MFRKSPAAPLLAFFQGCNDAVYPLLLQLLRLPRKDRYHQVAETEAIQSHDSEAKEKSCVKLYQDGIFVFMNIISNII